MAPSCAHQRVACAGTLAAAWATRMPDLKALDLSLNSISGSLPPQWAAGFVELKYLDLGANGMLSGTVPSGAHMPQ